MDFTIWFFILIKCTSDFTISYSYHRNNPVSRKLVWFVDLANQLLKASISLSVDDVKPTPIVMAGAAIRRRPGGKQKRRPQLPLATLGASEDENNAAYWRGHIEDDNSGTTRRKQLSIRQPMAALDRERDRQRQPQEEEAAVGGSKAYRRPYGQSKKQELEQQPATTATENKSTVDLKNILKNSGGLSLSEILQQKNLSLDDLLKGKQNALLALQTTAVAPPFANAEPKTTAQNNNNGNKHSVRRIPAAFFEYEEQPQQLQEQKQLLPNEPKQNKLPALQRLKLFGTSRESGSSTRRTMHIASSNIMPKTVSSTAAAASTTRLPLYKKRQQMRSTLKPHVLLKTSSSTTRATTTTTTTESTATVATAEQPLIDITTTEITTNTAEVLEDSVDQEPESSELPPATRQRMRNNNTYSSSNNESTKEQNKQTRDNFIVNGNHYEKNSVESIEDVELELTENVLTTAVIHSSNKNNSTSSNEQQQVLDGDELENFFDEVESNTEKTRMPSPLLDPVPLPVKPQNPSQPSSQQPLVLLDDVDDRTDLLELIEDRRSGNRLFKVLEQRNMTLEELIEHRKRGSSQLHLSTILNNDEQSRFYPGQKVVLQDNMDIVTAFENFPHFNLIDLKSVKPDEIKTDSQGSSYFTSIINIEPNDRDNIADNMDHNRNRGPTYVQTPLTAISTRHSQQEQQRGEKSLGFFPSWKTLALASLHPTPADRNATPSSEDKRHNAYFLPPPSLLLDNNADTSQEQQQEQESNRSMNIDLSSTGNTTKLLPMSDDNNDVIDNIENEVARAHDLLDLELSGHGFRRSPAAAAAISISQQHLSSMYASMPAGIRSAIVASVAILLTSLATLTVIFVACRWRQHRRRKNSYLKTYNAMKSKLPQQLMTTSATSVSRRSSLRQQHMEELVVSGNSNNCTSRNSKGCNLGIATVSCSKPVHHLQRQRSLRFQREGSTNTSLTTTATATATAPAAETTTASGCGVGSLALTLSSTHQKLNTMDPNSPEVQEYLFDTWRKSLDN